MKSYKARTSYLSVNTRTSKKNWRERQILDEAYFSHRRCSCSKFKCHRVHGSCAHYKLDSAGLMWETTANAVETTGVGNEEVGGTGPLDDICLSNA